MAVGPVPDIPGGPLGAVGALLGLATGLLFWLRRAWRRDGLEKQTTEAPAEIIKMTREENALLREQIKLERIRSEEALTYERQRGDAAMKLVAELRAKLEDLNTAFEAMQKKLRDSHVE